MISQSPLVALDGSAPLADPSQTYLSMCKIRLGTSATVNLAVIAMYIIYNLGSFLISFYIIL